MTPELIDDNDIEWNGQQQAKTKKKTSRREFTQISKNPFQLVNGSNDR